MATSPAASDRESWALAGLRPAELHSQPLHERVVTVMLSNSFSALYASVPLVEAPPRRRPSAEMPDHGTKHARRRRPPVIVPPFAALSRARREHLALREQLSLAESA